METVGDWISKSLNTTKIHKRGPKARFCIVPNTEPGLATARLCEEFPVGYGKVRTARRRDCFSSAVSLCRRNQHHAQHRGKRYSHKNASTE
jgi:hypothetical protein